VIASVWKHDPFHRHNRAGRIADHPETIYEQAEGGRNAASTKDSSNSRCLLLKRFLAVALIFSIDAIRVLDLIYVLTDGGPGLEPPRFPLTATSISTR